MDSIGIPLQLGLAGAIVTLTIGSVIALLKYLSPILEGAGKRTNGGAKSGDLSPAEWELRLSANLRAANEPIIRILDRQTEILQRLEVLITEKK